MRRSFIASAVIASTLALSACSTTDGLAVGIGVVGTALGAISKDADYAEYAGKCKDIIVAQAAAEDKTNTILLKAAETKASEVLLFMAFRPSVSGLQQCALAVPEGFWKSLAKNGGLLNFFATVYGINRGDSQAQRSLQVNKEINIAQLNQEVQMESLRNQLIGVFGQQAVGSFNAGAAAARPAPVAAPVN